MTPKAKYSDIYINLVDQIIRRKDLFDLLDGCQWPSCELESKEANSSAWEDYEVIADLRAGASMNAGDIMLTGISGYLPTREHFLRTRCSSSGQIVYSPLIKVNGIC